MDQQPFGGGGHVGHIEAGQLSPAFATPSWGLACTNGGASKNASSPGVIAKRLGVIPDELRPNVFGATIRTAARGVEPAPPGAGDRSPRCGRPWPSSLPCSTPEDLEPQQSAKPEPGAERVSREQTCLVRGIGCTAAVTSRFVTSSST